MGFKDPAAFVRHMSLSIDEIRCLGTALDRFMGWSGSAWGRSGYLVRFTHRPG